MEQELFRLSRQPAGEPYQPATRTYATTWTDFGTTCERCHGPGSAHVDRYRGGAHPGGDRAIVRPTRLDPKTSSMVCAQCHSLRDVIGPGFAAGADYFDTSSRSSSTARARSPIPPTGLTAGRGVFQTTRWDSGRASASFAAAPPARAAIATRTCLTSTRTRSSGVEQRALHRLPQPIGAAVTSHTRHLAGSPGSSCVECHMPRTVLSIKARIRDHSMSLPAPENTVRFAIPNACNECHADKKASWAVEDAWRSGGRKNVAAKSRCARTPSPAAALGARRPSSR